MMKSISLFIMVSATLIFIQSCYYDNEEDLFPQVCDTIDVSFETQVLPIIEFNCHDCHGELTSVQRGIFRFVSYDDIKAKADSIVGAISWEKGILPMPDNLPKLDNCDISIIRSWVNAGAPDN